MSMTTSIPTQGVAKDSTVKFHFHFRVSGLDSFIIWKPPGYDSGFYYIIIFFPEGKGRNRLGELKFL